MSYILKDYELSVWSLEKQVETKLAIIGGQQLSSPARAQNPILIRNINGSKSLTFSLYYEYYDEIEGETKKNPFCPLLTNGRIIKLFWKNKWYEFAITNIVENSEEKKITYTTNDNFIDELSKRGFDVELSTELENNQGTIFELSDIILEKSEWSVDKEQSLVGPQVSDEILVEMITSATLRPTEITSLDINGILKITEKEIKIPEGKKIYGFYSTLLKQDAFFQFFYNEDGNYVFDDEGNLIDCPLYGIESHKYTSSLPEGILSSKVTTYKGKKLIRTQKSQFDNVLQTYVKIYEDSQGNEVKGYTETEYLTEDFVTNLVTNNTDFVSDIGWYSFENSTLDLYSFPEPEVTLDLIQNGEEITPKSFIRVNSNVLDGWIFYNSGFDDRKYEIKNLFSGQKFVVRLKYGYSKAEVLNSLPTSPAYDKTSKRLKSGFSVALCTYTYDEDGEPEIHKIIFEAKIDGDDEETFVKDGDYWTAIVTSYDSFSKTQLEETNFGFFFKYQTTSTSSIDDSNFSNFKFFIEDCQIFEYKERINSDGEIDGYYLPTDVLDGEARQKYSYFYSDQSYETQEDINYLYQGYKEAEYNKKYYENYLQIRTVTAKESNFFNLIQSLCETFECWADFVVEHDSLGYIKKNSNGNFIKKIIFKPYIGKENWAGFRRGINLKKIDRTIASNQIVTKTIVKANSNEFAPNGFCTIAYSDENPSGESFIYDFRYYESKGLINSKQLNKDLYGTNGLYTELKETNKLIDKQVEIRSAASLAAIAANKEKQVQEAMVAELGTSIASAKKDFRTYSGMNYNNFLKLDEEKQKEIINLAGVSATFTNIVRGLSQTTEAQAALKAAKEEYKKQYSLYKSSNSEIKRLTKYKEKIILNFETKYAAYIKEGNWISEDYIDHNLYYIDACSVAATSSVPQVSYNIEVVDISSLEEFFNYNIDIGDKTYVIDPEFFGYVFIDDVRTPKKQEVIISEMTEVLENPQENKVVVQNFKTQFDDLFQRITATSQQLQLNTGSYLRATKAFDNNGLNPTVTQNSLNNSEFNLQNNSIQWNTDGLTCINQIDKRQYLKISNGSLFITPDGGNTWGTAITGKGINANYIYTGQLDAGKINIVTELKTNADELLEYALVMDKDGLSMYSYDNMAQQVRVRLGKIYENNEYSNELYGLQLYDKTGKQTFKTDSDGNITMSGTIYAKAGSFTGSITAASGTIGGWTISQDELYHRTSGQIDAIISTSTLKDVYSVNNYATDDWRLLFGIEGTSGSFGVTNSGNLYANGVDIKDGNISFGDIFKITKNGGREDAVSFGLNIELDPENENEAIVIESDDRVIGIREKAKNDDGSEVRDENGNPVWVWKTILGDLSNATLGGKTLEELGLTSGKYGLFTDHGLFKGSIIAGNGQIGGFAITDSCLYYHLDGNDKAFDSNGNVDLEKIEGMYIGSDGRFHLGSGDTYIRFDSTNKDNQLEISGASIKIVSYGESKFLDETINEVKENAEAMQDSISKASEPKLGYRFSGEGLIIYDGEKTLEINDVKTTIDDSGLTVERCTSVTPNVEWEKMLVADVSGVIATDLQANTYISVGQTSRIENYFEEGNSTKFTGCYWIGG